MILLRRCLLISLLVSLAAGAATVPQETFNIKAAEYLQAQEKINGFSGSVLYVQEGKVWLRRGVGLANRELNVANAPETKFRLGSITKQFTATAIMLLEQRGKLSVEDAIDKHFPNAPDHWKKVTVRHLLSHTGGVPSYTNDPGYLKNMFKPHPLPELIAGFRDKPLEFEPGSSWKYSNSGYVLLGDIIERVSGEKYEEFIRRNIFEPLEMKNTGYDHWETILANRAAGYSRGSRGWVNAAYLDMTLPYSAGALYSTIDDLYLWDRALYTDKVLPQAVLERMFTPVKNGYGYGWSVTEEFGRAVIGHGGGINGFSTFIGRARAENSVVIVLSNVQESNAGRVARDLGAISHGEKYDLPQLRKVISLNPAVFDSYTGKYELAPNVVMTVSREGARFLTQVTGQPQVEIYPESEAKFFVKVVDAQITFVKDATGKATELILNQSGRSMTAKRVE
ncbi:MAG: serine hydrolase [Acidobacteria bacterium]|nr:serine hydrolase [Acidobacteriota bacterium]